jgi:hypothetical protein
VLLAVDRFKRIANPLHMFPFSTEFPVRPNSNRAAFVAEVVGWLRGMERQTVLSGKSEAELDGANVHIRSDSGEELRMRELRSVQGWFAIGARHDLPDNQGRLWRTECVMRRGAADQGQDLVRLRTQCLAVEPGARIETAKRPYLIKAMLRDGWGGIDKSFEVKDQPYFLKSNDEGLSTAKAVTYGQASKWLPTVYVSSTGNSAWLLSKREIEKLAYDLGGIAHVVVEPDRAFSFTLRTQTEALNAYAGTLALSAPGRGIVRRYYLGWQIQDTIELAAAVRIGALTLRSQMPSHGWEWTELQEQALRAQREAEKNRLTAAENEQLYLAEIENLQDRVQELEQERSTRQSDSMNTDDASFTTDDLIKRIGPEIYPGEVSDRLRLAAKISIESSEKIGLDARSKAVFERVLSQIPASPGLGELQQDLVRATRDGKRVANEVPSLLSRHGYVEKSDNKHIRLEAKKELAGLDSITVPKTPSDDRGLTNLRKQVERTLGLTKLGS